MLQSIDNSKRLLIAAAVACLAVSGQAQGRPAGSRGGGSEGRGSGNAGPGLSIGGFGAGLTRTPTANDPRVTTTTASDTKHGLQLGPPGRWWDDKQYARTIGLNSFQQQRMDDVFGANKDTLLKLQKSLQHEESQLQKITRNRGLDENQIFQQIDRVTTARGDLEKAYAHMLLMIRKELTPGQTAKLDDQQPQ